MFYQQPVSALAAVTVIAHANQHEAPAQSFAFKFELEITFGKRLFGVRIALRLPITAIPDHHGTPAVLAFRNGAFEITVVEWMILNFDSKALIMGIK